MSVFVTGDPGFLGTALLDHLRANPVERTAAMT